jgi:biotin transport system substrate-specific component
MAPATAGWREVRRDAFALREELGWLADAALAFSLSVLVGATAYLELHLPWSPVPVTLQTFWVLLAGALLGRRGGPASMGLYGAAGVAGAGWFAGGTTGWGVLTGATGGYLLAFPLAAGLVGWVVDRFPERRSFRWLFATMLVADAVILLVGSAWLAAVLGLGLPAAFVQGALVFVPGDVTKAAGAAAAATALLPKDGYGPEAEP